MGTITAAGIYTAPTDLPSPAIVQITVTSQADSSKSATAQITITSDIGISIAPPNASIELGAVQSFHAAITSAGHPDSSVRWSLSGAACPTACGNVDLNGNYTLRCSEAPWWFFKDRTFVVTNQGVVINGSTVRAWKDASEAPQQLQAIAAKIKLANDRSRNDPHVLHSRRISCRTFHPSTKSCDIHDFATTCAVKSLCNGIPNIDSLRDGDPINWNSPVGSYIKQQNKISDIFSSVGWIRTQ